MEQIDDVLARDLGRQLTAFIAPKEAPLFDEIVDENLQSAGTVTGDHPLGFGSEIMEIVSYALYDVSKKVIAYLLFAAGQTAKEVAKDVLKKELKPKIERWITTLFSKPHDKETLPVSLSSDQIIQLLNEVDRSLMQKRIRATTREQVRTCLSTALRI